MSKPVYIIMGSVVTSEIEQFNRLAETWWDPAGPMWPLHRLNALRAPYIERHVRSHFQLGNDARVLTEEIAPVLLYQAA